MRMPLPSSLDMALPLQPKRVLDPPDIEVGMTADHGAGLSRQFPDGWGGGREDLIKRPWPGCSGRALAG